jgi:uncharacterized UBP type Zn finger protein
MQGSDSVIDAKVNMLVGLGFSPKPAREALRASGGNVDHAIEVLLEEPTGETTGKTEVSSRKKSQKGAMEVSLRTKKRMPMFLDLTYTVCLLLPSHGSSHI